MIKTFHINKFIRARERQSGFHFRVRENKPKRGHVAGLKLSEVAAGILTHTLALNPILFPLYYVVCPFMYPF